MEAKIGITDGKQAWLNHSNQNQVYFASFKKHVGNDLLRKEDMLLLVNYMRKVMLDGQSKFKAELTPEVIRRLYWEDKKSLPEIGKLYRIDSGSLYRWMKQHGIHTRSKLVAAQLHKKLTIRPDKLYELYWKKSMTTSEIGKLYDVSGAAVQHLMLKHKIPTRTPLQIGSSKTKSPSYKILHHLYIVERKSTIKIGKQLGVAQASVRKWLKKYKISVRSRSEACREYTRTSFSGDKTEKSYMLGFCVGDAYVSKRYQSIDIHTTTTHPAMIKLFHTTFSGYGHPSKYARSGTLQYEWALRCSLDQSFSFLLEKYKRLIPDWVLEDDTTFYSFLAGYADAEGCWMVIKSHKDGIGALFEIRSRDVKVLETIKAELEKYDYHPTFGLCSGSLHFVRLSRASEIRELAKKLLSFSKHDEKIEKMQFILDIEKEKSWSEIRPKLLELKDKIRSQVLGCVLKAEGLYKEKQRMEVMQL
ncbi:MAG: hypothetical protein HYW23_00120 [Candidatus Aenigmarchaeota archaeon]|nr:hypothetical protein [Candidatus Aenigmarchaeota archaeon]